jgi:transcriptional regulator with XRE-family HTH domain
MDASRGRRPKSIHDPAYRKLCASLRQLREDKGLTQRDLAEALGEVRSFVWRTETGERRLDAVELVRWCLACEADPVAVLKEIQTRVKSPVRRV